jgi:hypothetical protein
MPAVPFTVQAGSKLLPTAKRSDAHKFLDVAGPASRPARSADWPFGRIHHGIITAIVIPMPAQTILIITMSDA